MQPKINLTKGQGNLDMLYVETEWSVAEIYLHGAHVTHFQRKGEPPILWLSKESNFDDASPIRGGIPIILPWFGPREGFAAHGFARVRTWQAIEKGLANDGTAKIHLHLPVGAAIPGVGPLTADYFVTVGQALELELVLNNVGGAPLVFENCLHTYFTVGDIASVSVTGLKDVNYLDKVGGSVEKTEANDAIKISSEVDRVYQDTTSTVEIHDESLRRKIIVEKENSHSTVVWNPWISKSKAMTDFGDEEYHTMICVESGNVGKNKVTIAPGKSASLKVSLKSHAI